MSASKVRVRWPDVAKGISILGVVLLHSVLYSVTEDTPLGSFSSLLAPVRMGLFFLVSGIFAIKVRRISFDTVLRTRLWIWVIPYIAWSIITWYIRYCFGARDLSVWSSIAFPPAGLWFLYALTMFTIVVHLTRKWALRYVLLLSFAISLLVTFFELPWVFTRSFLFFPIFVLGMMFRDQWIKMEHFTVLKDTEERRFDPKKILLVVTSAVGYIIALNLGRIDLSPLESNLDRFMPVIYQIRDTIPYLLALIFGVLISIALSRVPKVSDALMWYGRHTLPIYLVNEGAAWLMLGLSRAILGDSVMDNPWIKSLFSLCFFLCMMAICHLAVWLAEKKATRWMFYPPSIESIGKTAAKLKAAIFK